MRAYIVYDAAAVEQYREVVFADNVVEAKKTAMLTDACVNAEYIDIRARRCRELDDSYRGHSIMDWYDTLDRIDLVSKANFWCLEPDRDECAECCAKDECEDYLDWLEELEETREET